MAHTHHHHGHHGHDHSHGHPPQDFSRAFAIGIILNSLFVIVEFIYGYKASSLALMADAGHNLSDVLSLGISWTAVLLSKRPKSPRFSYGLRSSTILAALLNASILLVALGALSWEALGRITNATLPQGATMSVVAGVGIIINASTALLFFRDRHHDLNIRGAYLHMVADAAISFAVLISGLVIMYKPVAWLDPVLTLIICFIILWSTLRLLYEAVLLSLHSVPSSIDIEQVQRFLEKVTGVSHVHDLHVWGLSTTESALSCHLVFPAGYPGDEFIEEIREQIKCKFHIGHATIQVETKQLNHACSLN